VTFLTQCDTGTDIFVCIRRNPLKSLDSAEQMRGMQAIFLGFIWITLHLFGRRTPFRGGVSRARTQGGSANRGWMRRKSR
jgi:hypothetical protein